MNEKSINIEFTVKSNELSSSLLFLRDFIRHSRNYHHYVPQCFYEIIGKLYAEHCDFIDSNNENTTL